MNFELVRGICYIAASILFVFGLKMLSSPTTARKGNMVSAIGMLIAVVTALSAMAEIRWAWIIAGAGVGSTVGVLAARLVKMTSMPQMVGLFNGFGGLASLLVGWSEFHSRWAGADATQLFTMVTMFLTVLIGGVTFSGSLVAYGKLAGAIAGKPILYKGQNAFNSIILVAIVALGIFFCTQKLGQVENSGLIGVYVALIGIVVMALALGVLSTIGIGGADMPVVICLLNSYSGLAACAAGFVINNNVLIVAGSLVGASGIILTSIMCKAMNRSLANVLFSGFGSATSTQGAAYTGEAKPISPENAYLILEAARSVVFVPGYAMAVAQAQHVVRELGDMLIANGAEVKYCIHPVAGRMPGHMNVLLAEADVPYDKLKAMDDINPSFEQTDVAIVIGANDVVNPLARTDPTSPIAGMPILNVDKARTVVVIKRSLSPGFAGIPNPLFAADNTLMYFGDGKVAILDLITAVKEA